MLTTELDIWLNQWRPKIKTDSPVVFTSLSYRTPGILLTDSSFGSLVSRAVYKATGYLFRTPKRTTPHIFRNIATTYQRQHGDPSQKAALAELMGHSEQVADQIYDRTSSLEKTNKAQEWWKPRKAASIPKISRL